ncbi:serine hydrolase [Streptomyces echinatus]|uniref:CubicO group peptidase (Beta-lactamase class C family) n=1 Tax=Streptomyces echinatus TaxID=67293 RepID=A0A7W9PSN8_9ACTN|nr:serine hydrolase [Streptomyces echinatus]MBB5926542.1 CubicO group peptidase (beta-lactamase class C family) [Streptomyces echinatus]
MALQQPQWNLTDKQYRSNFDLYVTVRGYRIVDLCGYEVPSSSTQAIDHVRFGVIWEKWDGLEGAFHWSAHHTPVADYQGIHNQRTAEGYRPVRISGHTVLDDVFIASIWEKSTRTDREEQWGIPYGELYSKINEIRSNGQRVVDVTVYPGPANDTKCALIWENSDGRDWAVVESLATAYQHDFESLIGEGYRPVRVFGHRRSNPGGQPDTHRFISLWERENGASWIPLYARHGVTDLTVASEVPLKRMAGYRMVALGGFNAAAKPEILARFCPIWERREMNPVISNLVRRFLVKYNVPGLSVAVAKGGQLVYAQGFGYADKTSLEGVKNSSLFRIASASKPITATAVMKLASEGSLAPADLVFGSMGWLNGFDASLDPKFKEITVRHLLEHSCGGWANDSSDPIYVNPSFTHKQLIAWVLSHRPLQNPPGLKFAYSNFGYCLLGRIIERASGKPYEAYVRDNILGPCGITDMYIAGNTVAERRAGEVTYYDQAGGNPYGIPVTRMDSHGGWLGTATDLVKFMSKLPDLLDSGWLDYMTKPSGLSGSDGYALGWRNYNGSMYHGGDFAGTNSYLARTADGYCLAVLTNTRKRDSADLDNVEKNSLIGLGHLMWSIRDQVDLWT